MARNRTKHIRERSEDYGKAGRAALSVLKAKAKEAIIDPSKSRETSRRADDEARRGGSCEESREIGAPAMRGGDIEGGRTPSSPVWVVARPLALAHSQVLAAAPAGTSPSLCAQTI